MKRLLLLLFLCAAALHAQSPVTVLPDCRVPINVPVGATVPYSPANFTFDNRVAGCTTWQITYNNDTTITNRYTVLSLVVQTAPNANGAPGSWSTFAANSPTINPNTSATQAVSTFGDAATPTYFPWVRVQLTSATGTGGTISGQLYGWRVPPQSAHAGGLCPGGSNTQIQYNDAGDCGGISQAVYNPATGAISWSGEQTWLAHNAMGAQGVVNADRVLNMAETITSITAGNFQKRGINVLLTQDLSIPPDPSGSVTGVQTGILTAVDAINPSNSVANYSFVDHYGSGTMARGTGFSGEVYNEIDGTITHGRGAYFAVYNFSTGPITNATGVYSWLDNESSGSISKGYNFYALSTNLGAGGVTDLYAIYSELIDNSGGGTIANNYTLWNADQTSVPGITNNYFLWNDSPGVFRVNAAGVTAYYNPTFTKYTPGATNFERVVQQWNTNVAEIGTEAGGTGALRRLRLLGLTVEIPSLAFASLATPNNATEVYCTDCTVTSSIDNTCASGGTGAWAERIAGAYKCEV